MVEDEARLRASHYAGPGFFLLLQTEAIVRAALASGGRIA
jgi:hypothetical protein